MKNLVKTFAAVLVAGVMGLGSVAAIAAEDAAGVIKHSQAALATVKEALAHAQAGHKEPTLEALKQAKQHMKEVTGDYLGASLQQVNARIRAATAEAEKGDMAKATEVLNEAVAKLTEVEKKVAAQHK